MRVAQDRNHGLVLMNVRITAGWLFLRDPTRIHVSLPSPEDGNTYSFRNVVFTVIYSSGRWIQSRNPVVLSVYTIVRTLYIPIIINLEGSVICWTGACVAGQLSACAPWTLLHTSHHCRGWRFGRRGHDVALDQVEHFLSVTHETAEVGCFCLTDVGFCC
jgi:hypothetical protein